MVHHIILWKLKEDLSETEKKEIAKGIKENLEALVGKISGLTSLQIVVDKLESSNADVMLNSVLESEEALKGYQKHPDHVHAANTYVRPFTEIRMCIDYEE